MTNPSRMPENRRAKYTGKNTVTIAMDTTSLNRFLDELGESVDKAVRPAAQAGAQVLYDQVRSNVARMTKSGQLLAAIYQVYSKDRSSDLKAIYHIGVNNLKAGWWHNVEFGHLQRYAAYQDEQGRVRLRVRPEMIGKPKPSRGGGKKSRARLDAYYVPLAQPVHVAAKPFLRSAVSRASDALVAAENVLFEHISQI